MDTRPERVEVAEPQSTCDRIIVVEPDTRCPRQSRSVPRGATSKEMFVEARNRDTGVSVRILACGSGPRSSGLRALFLNSLGRRSRSERLRPKVAGVVRE